MNVERWTLNAERWDEEEKEEDERWTLNAER